MRLGATLTSHIAAFVRLCCLAAAFLPPLVRRSRLALTLAEREDLVDGTIQCPEILNSWFSMICDFALVLKRMRAWQA
jgi:hypothetical protein